MHKLRLFIIFIRVFISSLLMLFRFLLVLYTFEYFYFYRDLYKPQRVVSIEDSINAVNSGLQDSEMRMWLKRRVGGASIASIPVEHLDIDNIANVIENGDNQIVGYQWKYIPIVIITIILIVYLLNRWKCLGTKRHFCRKRTIIRIRRIIQTIAMRRIPAQM